MWKVSESGDDSMFDNARVASVQRAQDRIDPNKLIYPVIKAN